MLSFWRGSGNLSGPDGEDTPHGVIEMKGSKSVAKSPPKRSQWTLGMFSSSSEPKKETKFKPMTSSHAHREAVQPAENPFLETTVRANSQTHLTCTTRGVLEAESCEGHGREFRSDSCMDRHALFSTSDQDYFEVNMVMRIPKSRLRGDGDACGSETEQLRAELQAMEVQCQEALKALDIRSQECESLLGVVKELTESRSKLSTVKLLQNERLADLQQEYLRVLRVANLSRAISKENLAKTAQTMKKLNEVEEELARQKAQNQQTKERLARTRIENMELREKLSLLQRLDMIPIRRESACMIEFQQLHLKETY